MCGFAIAQPLFDLLGKNPTFFVAHDLDKSDIVTFALGVVFLPPLALFGVLFVSRLVSRTVARVLIAATAGALIALIVVPPIARAIGFSKVAWIVAVVIVAVVAAVAYDRARVLRTFVTYLTPAPILFLVILLFFSSAHVLVTGSTTQAATIGHVAKTPVVMVVFDEFPLGALMDDQGDVNRARFPGFGRLADMSTWYRNAATIAVHTHQAVPAVASGVLPVHQPLPVAASYPRSIFTMLAGTHFPHAIETITRLCSEDVCRHRELAAVQADLVDDVETVYLHSVLSDELAIAWGVPPTNDRWAAFGKDEPTLRTLNPKADRGLRAKQQIEILNSSDKIGSFRLFDATLGTGRSPGLWFLHSLLPHRPYLLLPGGTHYDGQSINALSDDLVWGADQDVVNVAAQRMTLQLMATDELLNQMLDRLMEQRILDDALVVVTADHGAVFKAGKNYRALSGVDDGNKDQELPVPLFIKYPKQREGDIDRRSARTIDIVPTIAEALHAALPDDWKFDGVSLLGAEVKHRRYLVVPDAKQEPQIVSGPVDAQSMADYFVELLGPGGGEHDGYRIGPYGAIVGAPAAPLVRDETVGSVDLESTDFEVTGAFGVVPAKINVSVDGDLSPDDWVAVVVNGTIAGLGPVYDSGNGLKMLAMFDPTLLHNGANDVQVYRVDANGTELRPLR